MFVQGLRYHQFRWKRDKTAMALKNSLNETLSDQQRLERLAKLCEELQSAVDGASVQRRILEELKQTAQELLSDAESKPIGRRKKR
jgi:hypothetical protein